MFFHMVSLFLIWFPPFISRGRSHPSTKPKPIPTLQAIAFSCGWSARSNPLSRWQDMGRSAVGVERIQRIARKKLWYGWILTYVSYVHINYQVWSGYNLSACINIIFGGETVVSPSRKVTLADEMQVTGVESEYVSGRLGSSTNPHLDLWGLAKSLLNHGGLLEILTHKYIYIYIHNYIITYRY